MSSKLFSNITSTLTSFLNKDYSGTISQEVLDNLTERSDVEKLDVSDEIKTPYILNTKKLFEVTYGRVEKNITRLKSKKKKYKVQIQYNYEQHKEYLGYTKTVYSSISDGNITSHFTSTKANTLRDAISKRNKIRKTLPGRITIHSNGVRKIENTIKNSIKRSDSTVSATLPVGVTFTVNKNPKGSFSSIFSAWYKTPDGEFASKNFSVKGAYDINSPELDVAKKLAIAVRNEYEYHLVNSIPYYVQKERFSRWWNMTDARINLMISLMKKIS